METWKDIQELHPVWDIVRRYQPYQVSNLGEVRNTLTGKKIQPYDKQIKLVDKYGVIQISLSYLMKRYYPYEWIKELEEGEEVKPLKEYPGYFITSYGRIWSMVTYKFMKPSKNKNNYQYHTTIGNQEVVTIHTLVGRNFLPEYREGLFILHKEETLSYPEINYVSNLWVGTNSDNMKDSYRKGRKKNQYMKSYIEKYPLSETY